MTTYDVYYTKPEVFSRYYNDTLPLLSELSQTHTLLRSIDAENMEQVFSMMQAENWSPNGEARLLIKASGLAHTSMSVGDILHNRETDEWYFCAMVGFKKLA